MGNNEITDLVAFLEPSDNDEPEINEETGEEIKPEETEDATDKPTETPEDKVATDDTPKEDTEPTDEDTPAEEAATPAKKEPTLEEQNRELRQIMRQQSKDLRILQSKLDRIEKRSTPKSEDETLDDLLSDKEPPKEELSDIEVAQAQLAEIASVRGPVLDVLIETMEMNPKYEDVREVCSQNNFSDIFAAVGESLAEKEGADPTVAAMEAEVAVWKMPNPYKYMYDIIKKFHPLYAKTNEPAPKPAAKKLPDKAPSSIANVPGENAPTNKWTAARIDEMPEDELDTVPEDIYQKYLAGDLD